MPISQNSADTFEDPCGDSLAVEARDPVASVSSIKPGIGEPIAAADAQGKQTIARPDPIERDGAVGLRLRANSGSGTPSGNRRRKRLAMRTAKGSIAAASAPSQPACMHSVARAANRERAPAFSPNNATERSIDSTILAAALRTEQASGETAVLPPASACHRHEA